MGMTNVAHIDGGFTEWVKQGAPTETLAAHKQARQLAQATQAAQAAQPQPKG
jgi:3-mercaptopyruvate sulfurtransferase SseA